MAVKKNVAGVVRMNRRIKLFDGKRVGTVKDAVKRIKIKHDRTVGLSVLEQNKDFQKEFIRAFKATGAADLYDGYLPQYMGVIAQTLERNNKQIEEIQQSLKAINMLSELCKNGEWREPKRGYKLPCK